MQASSTRLKCEQIQLTRIERVPCIRMHLNPPKLLITGPTDREAGLGIPAARIRVTQIPSDHRDVVKLFQRKVVQYRNQPGDERADFQQYGPEDQAITTRWGGHEPTLPIPDPRPLGYPERVAGYRFLREGEIPEVDQAGSR